MLQAGADARVSQGTPQRDLVHAIGLRRPGCQSYEHTWDIFDQFADDLPIFIKQDRAIAAFERPI